MAKSAARSRAYGLVRRAIQQGALKRPDRCEECGTVPRRARDGRPLIQGHHHRGYDRPLDVVWLCVDCHRAETPVNPLRGEQVFNAKLDREKVSHILRKEMSHSRYAALYGVHETLISQIQRGIAWPQVERPLALFPTQAGTE